MTLVVCVIPMFTGETINVDPKTGQFPDDVEPFKSQACAIAFTVLKYIILIMLYLGAIGVVYGIITYVPPAGTWPAGKTYPVAPAVQCTMILSAQFFIGARMRALNMDPVNGNPQKWAQNCFFMCTYALLAQTICSVAVPLVLQGDVKAGKCEGDMEYTVENKMLGSILAIGRYVMMICIYVGVACVIYSIFTIEHPQGR